MTEKSRYNEFEENDFVCDEAFQNWVKRPDAASEQFWNQWMEANPHRAPVVETARKLITRIHFTSHEPAEAQVQRSVKETLAKINDIVPRRISLAARINRRFARAAAIIAGAVLLTVAVYTYYNRSYNKSYVQTNYGELNRLYLPDSSLVVLNAKSNVEFRNNWKTNQREVWLQGEAFFEVRKILNTKNGGDGLLPFLVHTEHLTVEVVGTSFDIRERRGITEVVLQTGKVNVHINDGSTANILMKPGDHIIYDPAAGRLTQQTTTPQNYAAWVSKRYVSENATVRDIVHYLEDNFGCKIVINDPAIAGIKIEGPVMLDSLEDALFVLRLTLNVDVIEKDNTLIFRAKQK